MGKYFKFNGRATRSEYWGVNIIGMLLALIGYTIAVAFMMAGQVGVILGIITALAVALAYFWLWVSTSIRRCRDAAINPFWTAAVFVPYVGLVVWIVIGVLESKAVVDNSQNSV